MRSGWVPNVVSIVPSLWSWDTSTFRHSTGWQYLQNTSSHGSSLKVWIESLATDSTQSPVSLLPGQVDSTWLKAPPSNHVVGVCEVPSPHPEMSSQTQGPPQITKTFLLVKFQDLESSSQEPWKKDSSILCNTRPLQKQATRQRWLLFSFRRSWTALG